MGPQDFHRGRLIRPVADQKTVILLLVRAEFIQLRRRICRRQFRLNRAGIRSAGANAQPEQHISRALQLQRHIQRFPGQKGRLPCQQTALLVLEAGYGLQLFADPPAHSPGLLYGLDAEELRLGNGAALNKHPVLRLGVLF